MLSCSILPTAYIRIYDFSVYQYLNHGVYQDIACAGRHAGRAVLAQVWGPSRPPELGILRGPCGIGTFPRLCRMSNDHDCGKRHAVQCTVTACVAWHDGDKCCTGGYVVRVCKILHCTMTRTCTTIIQRGARSAWP